MLNRGPLVRLRLGAMTHQALDDADGPSGGHCRQQRQQTPGSVVRRTGINDSEPRMCAATLRRASPGSNGSKLGTRITRLTPADGSFSGTQFRGSWPFILPCFRTPDAPGSGFDDAKFFGDHRAPSDARRRRSGLLLRPPLGWPPRATGQYQQQLAGRRQAFLAQAGRSPRI